MKYIDIVIPTRNRFAKLVKAIDSIPDLDNIEIFVVCDGDKKTFKRLGTCERLMGLYLIPEHKGATYCRNFVIRDCWDGVLYATDDIIFQPNSIENAFKAFNDRFPDDDGVVGFAQTGNKAFHPSAVGLVGQKFLQRYPEKQLFFPGYFHFACQEIYWLASKYNKFHQEPTAIVHHLNPFVFKEEADQTHQDARKYKDRDAAVRKEREMKGLIWGDNA